MTASSRISPTLTMLWRAGTRKQALVIDCVFVLNSSCVLQWCAHRAWDKRRLVEVSHLAEGNIIRIALHNAHDEHHQEEEARQKAAWWEDMTKNLQVKNSN